MEEMPSWRQGPAIISAAILLIVCVALWAFLQEKCLASIAAQPTGLFVLPFLLFVAYEIVVILHHLARIFVAKLVGLRLLAFAWGPFTTRWARGRMRFGWNSRQAMIAGMTAFAPSTLERLRWQCIWLIASGPAAMILFGLFFLVVVRMTDPARAPIEELLNAALAAVGVVVGVRLLLPFPSKRSVSYGTLLLDALRGKPKAEVLFLVTTLMWEGHQGIRPRDWSSEMVDLALRLSEKTSLSERVTVCFLAYFHALDHKNLDRAAEFLQEAVTKVNPKLPSLMKTGQLYSRVMLEKAFFEAWFRRDAEKAREAFGRVTDWSGIPHYNWLRVSAALSLAEGKTEECQRQARESLEILRSLPVVHQMAIEWLEELIACSEVRC